MITPQEWDGYKEAFLDGFTIPLPGLTDTLKAEAAVNNETGSFELPFLYFTSIHSQARKVPIFTASNIFRDKIVSIGREGNFKKDHRIEQHHQLNDTYYSGLNSIQSDFQKKIAKGHMTRREDVQWDENGDTEKAENAAKATFFYTNACPQHQGINNGIWKALENSILIRGHSRNPKKAIVFTGPVLDKKDPFFVTSSGMNEKVQCPLRFWKVVYFVNDKNELRCAAFLMSQKTEVFRDGFVITNLLHPETNQLSVSETEKPFLDFDERATYQVNVSEISRLTGLGFKKAKEALPSGKRIRLSLKKNYPQRNGSGRKSDAIVDGLVV